MGMMALDAPLALVVVVAAAVLVAAVEATR